MARSAVLALFFAAIVPGLGLAQEPAGGRYAFVPIAEGALRLDIETGEVSLCVGGEFLGFPLTDFERRDTRVGLGGILLGRGDALLRRRDLRFKLGDPRLELRPFA